MSEENLKQVKAVFEASLTAIAEDIKNTMCVQFQELMVQLKTLETRIETVEKQISGMGRKTASGGKKTSTAAAANKGVKVPANGRSWVIEQCFKSEEYLNKIVEENPDLVAIFEADAKCKTKTGDDLRKAKGAAIWAWCKDNNKELHARIKGEREAALKQASIENKPAEATAEASTPEAKK